MGAGNMASALLLPLKDELSSYELYFYTPSVIKAEKLALEMGQSFIISSDDPKWSNYFDGIFLAHKPQQLSVVGNLLKDKLEKKPSFIVSILAGKSVESIQDSLFSVPVLRLMPNTPCLVGRGVITEYVSEDFDSSLERLINHIFSTNSKLVSFKDEKKFDQATPILGSGPGILFEFGTILQNELMNLGVSNELSQALITELFLGTFELSKFSGESFDDLRKKVTSKGGITERMLEILEQKNISGIMNDVIAQGRVRGESL
jgi:pyrroline-5-carboxylate reductase